MGGFRGHYLEKVPLSEGLKNKQESAKRRKIFQAMRTCIENVKELRIGKMES